MGTVKTYRKNSSMVARKIGEELVLVPVKENVGDLQNVYTVNAVGLRIWELLEEKNTLPEIISTICNEFHVKERQATGDITSFLEQLQNAGAIETD